MEKEEGTELTNRKVFDDVLKGNLKNPFPNLIERVSEYVGCEVPQDKISTFVYRAANKWKGSQRNMTTFENKHEKWLKTPFYVPPPPPSVEKAAPKRPTKEFMALTDSSKRRRTSSMREELKQTTSDELLFVAKTKLHGEKRNPQARLVGEMQKSPGRASKILFSYKKKIKACEKFTPDEALALMTDLKLSKRGYQKLKNKTNKKCNKKKLPSYHKIREAKKRCYVTDPGYTVTEKEAVLDLQAILNLTTFRLLKTLQPSTFTSAKELTFVFKWGLDGSSGHVVYKQNFQGEMFDESTVLTTTIAPLLLYDENNVEIWKNPVANSSSFCRPIRICYEKETNENVEAEVNRVNEQISRLEPFSAVFGDSITKVNFKMVLSMLDVKAINVLEDNPATTVCYLCRCKPKAMSDSDPNKFRKVDVQKLEYGISPLHAWINCFSFFLHLSYRLRLDEDKKKKWARLENDDRALMKKTKEKIQDKFRRKMGLNVDVPKPGFGSSNDGNTARRFFQSPKKTAKITRIDEDLLRRFKFILIAINSSEMIDSVQFRAYTQETYKKFIQVYHYYPMCPTIHKILCHGADMIEHCILPLGVLGEECQEGSHKFFKLFRDRYARKSKRIHTMTDIMNRFLVFSDPLIGSLMEPPTYSTTKLPAEVQKWIKKEKKDGQNKDDQNTPDVACDDHDDSEDDDSEDEDSEDDGNNEDDGDNEDDGGSEDDGNSEDDESENEYESEEDEDGNDESEEGSECEEESEYEDCADNL